MCFPRLIDTRLNSPPSLLGFDRVIGLVGLCYNTKKFLNVVLLTLNTRGRAVHSGAGSIVLLDNSISGTK